MELTPIKDNEFLKKLKGCGIKYYSKIPRTQLKAIFGFCPTTKTKTKIEITDETGSKIFNSLTQAAREKKISNSTTLKYALDHNKSSITRRWDKKIFYIREIN